MEKDDDKKTITKVMRYELTYEGGGGSFHELQKELWLIQKQSREILNKTIREVYIAVSNGQKFDKDAENAQYHILRQEYSNINSSIVNATLREAKSKFSTVRKDVFIGNVSLPSYKSDQPVLIPAKCLKIYELDNDYIFKPSVFSDDYKKSIEVGQPEFKLKVKDKTQKSIIERVVSGEYALGRCQLIYERPKWFLNLTYKLTPHEKLLDKDKILGIDLGCVFAIYSSSFGSKGVFYIPGDEVSAFEKKQAAMQGRKPISTLERIEKMEKRKWQRKKQARYCGSGRIGHGTKTRVFAAYKDADKIARFRDTINHRYSRALVEYARKNGCGTIQMEDLSGIKEDAGFPKRLQHWTYFDLQTKIEYKAKEYGIEVKKIDPKYTSQRCSRCGHIDPANRPKQSEFKCVNCGFTANADYNASQNISIKDIDKIIKKSVKGANNK